MHDKKPIDTLTALASLMRLKLNTCTVQKIYVSHELHSYLPTLCNEANRLGGTAGLGVTLDRFLGTPIEVSDMLPVYCKKFGIEQLDKFAQYAPEDMEWAEPLGLARWTPGDVHAFALNNQPARSYIENFVRSPANMNDPFSFFRTGLVHQTIS